MTDHVEVIHGNESLEDAIAVRRRVFVDEQGVSEHLELDGRDEDATHLIAYDEDEPVGTARLREVDSTTGKAERVSVLPEYRGRGLGRRLMDELESLASDRSLDRIVLHAQTDVEAFYHRLGYDTTSAVFEEAGIPHVEMEKPL